MSIRPLAYNAIDLDELSSFVKTYATQSHSLIVTDFENDLKKLTHVNHVVALNSGTSALHLALKALRIGSGDTVIAPTFTYVATINPILYVGAEPVFVDCEKLTWNMDPERLEQAIQDSLNKKRKIRAIILVHTYGMPAQLDAIVRIANHYQIPLIEDAAESLGSTFNGQMTGTFGRIGVLSFNNNKIVTTYGGGATLTQDEDLAARIRLLSQQAREPLPYYEHREIGYNYAMSPLNAAYGLVQLPRLRDSIRHRRNLLTHYQRVFAQCVFQTEPVHSYSNRWLIATLLPSGMEREKLAFELLNRGWETRRLWRPMHLQPVFQKYPFYGTDLSQKLFEQGLCLPSGWNVSLEEIKEFYGLV